LTLFACDSSVQIISSVKQTIIPGLRTEKSYSKYLIEVELTSHEKLVVDSVVVFEEVRKCRKASLSTMDRSNNKLLVTNETFARKFTIEATVKDDSLELSNNCSGDSNTLILYYTENGKSKKVEISTFKEETVRKR